MTDIGIAIGVIVFTAGAVLGILAERYRCTKQLKPIHVICSTCVHVHAMIAPYLTPGDDGRTLPVLVRKVVERAKTRKGWE